MAEYSELMEKVEFYLFDSVYLSKCKTLDITLFLRSNNRAMLRHATLYCSMLP